MARLMSAVFRILRIVLSVVFARVAKSVWVYPFLAMNSSIRRTAARLRTVNGILALRVGEAELGAEFRGTDV